LSEGCADDIVMMHVRADGFRGIEPETMEQIDIGWREGRRMRTQIVGIRASTVVMNDEPDLEVGRFGAALPRLPSRRVCSLSGRVADSPT